MGPFCAQRCIPSVKAQLASGGKPWKWHLLDNNTGVLDLTYHARGFVRRGECWARWITVQIKLSLSTFLKCVLSKKKKKKKKPSVLPPWEMYSMRKYERRSRGTCHHCNTLEQHSAALRNTHWPTSLLWADKHWRDLAMYLFPHTSTPLPFKSPRICPTSLFLFLHHDCVIYQTP